jgi:hypothetical protein
VDNRRILDNLKRGYRATVTFQRSPPTPKDADFQRLSLYIGNVATGPLTLAVGKKLWLRRLPNNWRK